MACSQERRFAVNTVRLHLLLNDANRRLRGGDLLRTVLIASCVWLTGLLFVLATDAVLGIHAWGLIALDLILISLFLAALGWMVASVWRWRFDPRRMAVLVEQRLGLSNSPLINAIDLAMQEGPGSSVELRQQAVAQGEALAGELSPAAVVDRSAIRRAAKAAGIIVLVVAIAYVLMPGVFHAVLPRLFAPTAGHPPFTFVKFTVNVKPQTAIFGQPATINAKLTGKTLPHEATVVFLEADGQHRRVPMLRSAGRPIDEGGALTPAPFDGAGTSTPDAAHFVLRLERVERSRTFVIDTPKGRSKRYRLTVLPVPQFERVTFEYAFPKYTGWSNTSEPLGPSGIRALVGTDVAVTVVSTVALGRATLSITPTQDTNAARVAVELSPPSPGSVEVRGSFELTASGEYELSLVGADGTPGNQTLRGTVVCVPDNPPGVYIFDPPARAIVPEGWTVDVKIETSDDIGAARLVLHRGINGSGPTPIDLELSGMQPTHRLAGYRFDLGELGVRGGDVITYFATVYDNHPGGGQFAQTPAQVIQVIPQEDYLEYARAQYRIDDLMEEIAGLEERLDELATEREGLLEQLGVLQGQLDQDGELTDEQQQQMANLQAQLANYAAQMQELAGALKQRAQAPDLYDFEDAYKQMLQQLAEDLRQQSTEAEGMAKALADAAENDSPQFRNGLGYRGIRFKEADRPFCQTCQQERRETEIDLDKYRLADAVLAQAERIRLVVEQEQGLVERFAQFRNHDQLGAGERRIAQALAEQQGLLRAELQDARQRLREAAAEAQERLPGMSGDAFDLCDAIDQFEIEANLQDAEQWANDGSGSRAHEAAQSAADKLDSLLSDCEQIDSGVANELCDSLQLPRFKVMNALQQMARARGLPGLGQRGAAGVGAQGSMAPMAVMGPAMAAAGKGIFASGAASGPGARGRGRGKGAGNNAEAAEVYTGVQATERGQGASAMPGVPLQFRDDADAYFKRLAEESR